MTTTASTLQLPADWRDFIALTKPRVMTLVVFSGVCGLVASGSAMHPVLAFASILAIAMGAGGAAALNQWYESDLDAKMLRTANRPIPAGRMDRQSALHFGVGISVASVILMELVSNWLATGLLAGSILYYVLIYTVWLKRRTPQNIVIGGAAGAFPPVIGWVAASGDITLLPFLMFALIFLWTPPHSWALALFTKTDYAAAGVPMMPVAAGERSARSQILIYTLAMAVVAVLPWSLGLAGPLYGWTAAILSVAFVVLSAQVARRSSDDAMREEKQLFIFSMSYLFVLFGALALDRVMAL